MTRLGAYRLKHEDGTLVYPDNSWNIDQLRRFFTWVLILYILYSWINLIFCSNPSGFLLSVHLVTQLNKESGATSVIHPLVHFLFEFAKVPEWNKLWVVKLYSMTSELQSLIGGRSMSHEPTANTGGLESWAKCITARNQLLRDQRWRGTHVNEWG